MGGGIPPIWSKTVGKTDLMTEEKDTVSPHPQHPPGGGFGVLLIEGIMVLFEGGAVEA